MPRRDGVEATRRIVLRRPTGDPRPGADHLRRRRAGVPLDRSRGDRYLLKDVGSDALAEAIPCSAARGESPLQPSAARVVLERVRATAAQPLPVDATLAADPLSQREVEILGLLGTAATNREIAERLALTEGTVKNYISTFLAKTNLRDRTQAALFAVHHGFTTT